MENTIDCEPTSINICKTSISGDGNETIRIINIVLEDPFYLFSETVLPLNILSDGLVPDEDDRLNGVADEVFIQFVTLNVEIVPSVVSEVRVMLMNRTGG